MGALSIAFDSCTLCLSYFFTLSIVYCQLFLVQKMGCLDLPVIDVREMIVDLGSCVDIQVVARIGGQNGKSVKPA